MTVTDFPMLRGLADEERRRVVAAGVPRRFGAREVVFHEGDPGDTLHLLVSGRVAVRSTTRLGQVATLNLLGPGDAVGEMALLDPRARRTATVVALEPTHTLALEGRRFAELRRRHPQIDRSLAALLAAKLRRASEQVVESLYVPVEVRVARRLVELADAYGGEIRLTQDDLAGLVGTTRATANSVLRSLAGRGAVALRRGRIAVTDRGALERAGR
jgi:CRP/FNR family cyclic AMP-dependent transcriptional regulator